MSKRVLDGRNCGPDFSSIKAFLTKNFDCTLDQAHGMEDSLAAAEGNFDLVLINRKLDRDYSDGIEILREIKADAVLKDIPVMLITNHAEHQDAAMELGAKRGFGKLEFGNPETLEKLQPILG